MRYSIALKNLPFEPDDRQVIYVENQYDKRTNTFIRKNYEWLKWTFKQSDIDFIYLPMFFNDEEIQEKVLYYAPYLTSMMMESVELRSSFLLDFMSHVENREKIPPSLLFAPKKEEEEWIFQGITFDLQEKKKNTIVRRAENWIYKGFSLDIHKKNRNAIGKWAEQILAEIDDSISKNQQKDSEFEIKNNNKSKVRFSISKSDHSSSLDHSEDSPSVEHCSNRVLYHRFRMKGHTCKDADYPEDASNVKEDPRLEEIREERIEDIIEALERNVNKLRLKGMSLSTIYELIRNNEKLSRLCITEDLRIFLPDYNNKEIKLSAQYKAVYFLFLNHPEGIILQRLEEYHHELVNYYCQTSNKKELTPRMIESIKKLEVYDNNTLNIILSKIKSAFFSAFDEHLAKYYIITGKAGDLYKIDLDNNLIEWEDDYE